MSAEITLERNGRHGRYLLALPDSQPARLTFVETRPNHVAIDYSFVPPQYRGRGVARQLIVRAVEDARATATRSLRSAVMSPLSSVIILSGRTCWRSDGA